MSATHEHAGIATWKFKLKAEIHSFKDCADFMAEHGVDGFAELGPQMTVIHEGHDLDEDQSQRTYAVELYSTKIIRYYPDGTFSVDNGGYRTITTSTRLNAVMPKGFHVYHERRQLVLYGAADRKPIRGADHSTRVNIETREIAT